MTAYNSSLLKLLDERGYIHQLTDAAALDALASKEIVPGLHRLRRHRAEPPCRQPRPDHDAAPAAAGRAQADRADGRRHDQGRRPVGQGREPQAAVSRGRSTPTSPRIRRVFERFLTFGDGPTDAIMVNNADWLDTLEYIPFLREVGRALHDQPHADLRQRASSGSTASSR